jgi:hypothetical protein
MKMIESGKDTSKIERTIAEKPELFVKNQIFLNLGLQNTLKVLSHVQDISGQTAQILVQGY